MRVDLRLAVPAAMAWAGLAALLSAPEVLGTVAIVCWLAAGGAVLLAFAARRSERASAAVQTTALTFCCLALVISVAAAQAPSRRPAELTAAAHAGRTAAATMVTTTTVIPGGGSFAVDLVRVSVAGHEIRGSIPATVIGSQLDAELAIGTTIVADVVLRETGPADSASFLIFPRAPPRVLAPPPAVLGMFGDLRADFRRVASTLPGDGAALLPGLAIGDTSAVGPELDSAMKVSSLSHLTAVSGANCAIVVGLVMLAGRAVGLRRGVRVALSIAALGGFVVLVTPEPSVLRAAVMALIVLGMVARGRTVRGVPVLALAVIVLLSADPWLARNYGFTLSVLATGGLLLLARPLTTVLHRLMPLPMAAIIAVPFSAQLACQPVLILLAPSVPTFGVVANLLAGPAAPIATVLGLVSCLLAGPAEPLAHLIARFAWLPAEWVASVAHFFASAPGARLAWASGGSVQRSRSVSRLALLIAVLPGVGRTLRRVAASVVVLTAVGYWGSEPGRRCAPRSPGRRTGSSPPAMSGRGTPRSWRTTGGSPSSTRGPTAGRLASCLDQLGIGRLDLLVLTHFDRDHVAGARALVGRVDTVLTGPVDRPDGRMLLDELERGGARIVPVARGDQGRLGDLRWRVLWPTDPLRGTEPGNDASVTMLIEGVGECPRRCLSGVFLGDLGESSQDAHGGREPAAAGRRGEGCAPRFGRPESAAVRPAVCGGRTHRRGLRQYLRPSDGGHAPDASRRHHRGGAHRRRRSGAHLTCARRRYRGVAGTRRVTVRSVPIGAERFVARA